MIIALILVSLFAAVEAAGLLLVNGARVHWKTHDKTLKVQLDVDEALLEQLRGARPGVDANDPWRQS
jgi:hypothetical protein